MSKIHIFYGYCTTFQFDKLFEVELRICWLWKLRWAFQLKYISSVVSILLAAGLFERCQNFLHNRYRLWIWQNFRCLYHFQVSKPFNAVRCERKTFLRFENGGDTKRLFQIQKTIALCKKCWYSSNKTCLYITTFEIFMTKDFINIHSNL